MTTIERATAPAVSSTTTSETTLAAGPVRGLPVAAGTIALVDTTRPTISKGHTISATRVLTTDVWYPKGLGRWPLVVFAHGFEVGVAPYEHLCRAWAAAGYVVAAPRFPLTDAAVAGTALDEGDLPSQTADVVFVAHSLSAPTSTMASRVDPTRTAVAGHSDGGETALAVADERALALRAVIAMSASLVGGSSGHNPPLLAIQGDDDPVNPPAEGFAVYGHASAPRFLVRLLGGGHLPPFAGTTAWQPVVDEATIDFLDRYVADRSTSVTALLHDARRPLATIEADP